MATAAHDTGTVGKRTLTERLGGVGVTRDGAPAIDGGKSPPIVAPPGALPRKPAASPAGAPEDTVGGDGERAPHGGHPGSGRGGAEHAHRAAPAGARSDGITVHTHVAAPGNPARDRTTVGVGEQVTFSAAGGGTWRATGGEPTAGTGDSFEWTAPATTTDVTITCERHGHPAAPVHMHVQAPLGVAFHKMNDMPQTPAGVGMRTNLTFAPSTVSFVNCEWLELGGAGDGAPQGVEGYFQALRTHGGRPLVHNPNSQWLGMGASNHGVDDLAYIRDNPPINGAYAAGHFHWNIPNQYRLHGRDDTRQTFANVTQTFEITGAGEMTVRKGGQSATQSLAGVSQGAAQRFANVAEASAMIADAARGRQYQLQTALTTLLNLRSQDATSAGYLAQAIRAAAFELYVQITCVNSYSWMDDDIVRMTVTGQRPWQAPQQNMNESMPARQRRGFRVPFNSVFDYASWNRNPLTFNVAVESTTTHAMHLALPFAYGSLGGDGAELAGSGGRYRLKAFIPDGDTD
jgi:hypothetical protein